MPEFETYQEELDRIAKAQMLGEATQFYAQNANPQTSRNIASLADDFEWLPPGTAYALSEANITGESANAIAQMELQRQVENNTIQNRAHRRKNRKKRKDDPGFWGGVWEGLKDIASVDSPIPGVATASKAASRVAFGAMQSGSEAVVANLRMMTSPIKDEKDYLNPFRFAQFAAGPAFGNLALVGTAVDELMGGKTEDVVARETKERGFLGPWAAIAEQTTAGQAAIAAAKGDKIDVGSGWFIDPNSEIGKAQAKAAREYSPYLIGGSAWTPGRAVAGALFEPDTAPFTVLSGGVDAAVAVYADPAGLALDTVGAAMRARKQFETIADAGSVVSRFERGLITREEMLREAGAAVGRRPFVRKTNGVEFLYSQPGFDLADTIRETDNAADIWWGFRKNIRWETAERLAQETDLGNIRTILANEFGVSMQNVPKTWRHGTETNRWLIDIPNREIDPDNIDATLRNIEGTLVSANVPEARIRQVLNDVGAAHGRGDYYAAVNGVFDTIAAQMETYGLPPEVVEQVRRMFRTIHGDSSQYFVDALSGDTELLLQVGDELVQTTSPMLDIERLARGVTLPDPRELRAMTRRLEFLREGTNLADWGQAAGALGDVVMTDIWKPLVLLRPAWTLRVIGEEMLRVAVTGSGIFKHPISYLSAIIGDPSESVLAGALRMVGARQDPVYAAIESYYRSIGQAIPDAVRAQAPLANRAAEAIPGIKTRFGSVGRGITAEAFDREEEVGDLGEALSKVSDNLRRDQRSRAGIRRIQERDFVRVRRDNEIAHEGLVDELARLNGDADIRRAREMTSDEFKAWGRTPEGIERRRYLSNGRNADDPMRLLETNPETFDSWVDRIYQRLNQITDGDAELLEAARTGRIPSGRRLVDNDGNATQEALEWARGVLDDPQRLPNVEFLRAQRAIDFRLSATQRGLERLDSAVRTMFDYLMAKPTNLLNRSPEYRIKYWQEAESLIPNLNQSARRRLLRDLESGAIGRLMPGQEDRIIRALNAGGREGTLSLREADNILKQRSLDHVRELLYDMGKRNQTADALRLIFPFGEAWKEILTTWAKLLARYPKTIRRFQQAYQGAKEAEFDPNTGLPTGVGVGFFHYDPLRQEEVFTYPGSEFLTKELFNVPVPLVGSAKGLNMIGTGIPGVGPAIQIPVAAFLPDKPMFDGVRKILFPFGQPDKRVSLDQYFLPAYLKKLMTGINGPENDRIYMNTVFDVMRYLNSTGEYELRGGDARAEFNRLFTDAKEKAQWLYFVRVAAQASAPSAPSFNFQVEDKTGNLVMLQTLVDDWNKIRRQVRNDGGNESDALEQFVDKYGVDNVFASESKSKALLPGLSPTVEQRNWQRANPELVNMYPEVWPLLAPEGKKFSPEAYSAQIREGYREPVAADKAALNSNARLAEMIYDRRKEELDASPLKAAQRGAELRDLKTQLRRDFPGFTGSYELSKTDARIAELERAAVDPQISQTPLGKALGEYFTIRAEGILLAEKYKYAWPPSAEKSQWIGEGLVRAADRLIAQYPEFSRVWDFVLSNEVEVEG